MSDAIIIQSLNDHMDAANNSKKNILAVLPVMSNVITHAFNSGNKLLICGNGGSAADSQHLAAEFVSAFSRKINRVGLPAIALTVDTSILTAYANDFDYDGIFSRQVEALGKPGDVLLVFSTSGESKNCINAVVQAKQSGMTTLSFVGLKGPLKEITDHSLSVCSSNTQHIQEIHQLAYHLLVALTENQMFFGDK
jgi:D-sedoheptulose 7-phosphate isomerase